MGLQGRHWSTRVVSAAQETSVCLGGNVGEKLLHFCASSGWPKMKLYKNNMVLSHFELNTCSSKEENLITICCLLYERMSPELPSCCGLIAFLRCCPKKHHLLFWSDAQGFISERARSSVWTEAPAVQVCRQGEDHESHPRSPAKSSRLWPRLYACMHVSGSCPDKSMSSELCNAFPWWIIL